MSHLTYPGFAVLLVWMSEGDKAIAWLRGEVKTPPFSRAARIEAGTLLRRLQRGEKIGLPHSRPMPSVGRRCHELRIPDGDVTWRIVYRLDADAVIPNRIEIFAKKTGTDAPGFNVIDACKRRFKQYDEATR